MRYPAQCDDGGKLSCGFDRRAEKCATGGYFLRRRLVLRRDAADRIGDGAAFEAQAIVRAGLINSFGEAEFDQRRIKQITGIIARKGAAGSVSAAEARR